MVLVSKPRQIGRDGSEPHRQAVPLLEFLSYIRRRKLAAGERSLNQIIELPEESVLTGCECTLIFDGDVYHLHQLHHFHHLLFRQLSFEGKSVLRSLLVLELDLDPLSQSVNTTPYKVDLRYSGCEVVNYTTRIFDQTMRGSGGFTGVHYTPFLDNSVRVSLAI